MKTTHYMTLLKCIINNILPPDKVVAEISLAELYDFAALNKLAPLMLHLLPAWPVGAESEKELVTCWRGEATGQVFLEYKKLSLVSNLLQKAREQNLPLILFKGYVLADLYRDFTLRSSSDTDILIEPAYLQPAVSLLQELHYSPARHLDTANVYTFVYEEDGYTIHKIELHTSLFDDEKGPQRQTLNALQLSASNKLIRLQCCNLELCTLGHQEHLIYQLFHMAKHLCYYGLPARYLLDIALFIRQYHTAIDWEEFGKAMESLGYTLFYRQLFSILIHYFELPPQILPSLPPCKPDETDALLKDILCFGAKSYEEALGDYFYFFEAYVENLENKLGGHLDNITFDGSTVPFKIVPPEYQQSKKLQYRIHLLQQLQLI